MTAPVIFRRPSTDPLSALDGVAASANAAGIPVWGIGGATDGSLQTDGIIAVATQANVQVVDLANPAPAFAPIGVHVASFDSALQMISGPSAFSVFTPTQTRGTVTRNYVLADTDPAGTPDAYLRQTFTYEFHASGSVIWAGGSTLVTPDLTVVATSWATTITVGGMPDLVLGGAAGIYAGTITNGDQVVEYSVTIGGTWTSRDVNVRVTDTRSIGALPGAGVNPDGTATGLAFPIAYNDVIGGNFTGQAIETQTSSYELELFDSPPV